ncbi:hypothetical protein EDC01DRAFT_387004 [Geopyxis carbonaria]|nr:hypothetical protein EDC01DRAFT_387004 [Geopyxis carbonaria]
MASEPQPPFKVKALYDYSSGHDDDLIFNAEEVITVTAIEDDDWYYGEYKDKATGEAREGIFPMNFVERIKVEVPARPARTGQRKKAAEPELEQERNIASPPPPAPKEEEPIRAPQVEQPPAPKPAVESKPPPPPPVEEAKPAPKPAPVDEAKSPVSPKPAPAKPPGSASKPPPPDKPSSSSFKDRLALFNKGGAAPIQPFNPNKPRGDFIKKPFVPPPPSKNSYVPPAVSHTPKPKRDEDTAPPPPPPPPVDVRSSGELDRDAEENKPKQSLKERIALLQTQQMNPAGVPSEKPKRPPKPKRAPSEKSQIDEPVTELVSPEATEVERPRKSHDGARPERGLEVEEPEAPPAKPKRSVEIRREDVPADDSSAGEADVSSASAGPREESRGPRRPMPAHQSDFGDDEGANDTPDQADSEDEEEEEEEVDAEVARKIALRERMMKMSGGMGMHGVFGAPMGMPMGGPPPPPPAKKKKSVKSNDDDKPRKSIDGEEERSPETPQAPIPMIPVFPGAMPKVQSPPPVEKEPEYEDEAEQAPAGRVISEPATAHVPVDVEDMRPTSAGRPSGPRPMPTAPKSPPSVTEDRPVPAPPTITERPAPPPPPTPAVETRSPPPAPPRTESLSAGSESDDEMSRAASKLSLNTTAAEQPRAVPPPPPLGIPPTPTGRPGSSGAPLSPTSPHSKRQSQGYFSQPMSPTGPPVTPNSAANKRASYQRGAGAIPPIPGVTSPTIRAPPPPPPGGAPPPPRRSMDEYRGSDKPSDTEDEEVTEYEADYDTDIGNKVAHRDALTAQHGKGREQDEDEDTPLPSPTLTPPTVPSRAVPPPPLPTSLPPPARASADMPRAPPPAPPPGPPPSQPSNEAEDDGDDEYDPYKYDSPRYGSPGPSPVGAYAPPPPPPPSQPLPPPPTERQPSRGGGRPSMDAPRGLPPRASMDVSRGGGAGRRSMDQSRPHSDYVAREIELAADASSWWSKPNTLPPVFQSRAKDLRYEIEESSVPRRGGRSTMTKDVYILFHDYSQSVLTARYDRDDPSAVTFEQRHEPPPPPPRQDQLEDFQSQFGVKIFAGVKAREGTVVGDGDPFSLIKELFTLVPQALLPVGTRAFGALVYTNLANASVHLYDEIRAGDIITFRNAKFQGHKGGLHQKYTIDVGKPDHVGIVVDWDGTKKKIRAYEQGRESRKVKIDSFKVGDLRSGEVKVWRVAGREWVGWDSTSGH